MVDHGCTDASRDLLEGRFRGQRTGLLWRYFPPPLEVAGNVTEAWVLDLFQKLRSRGSPQLFGALDCTAGNLRCVRCTGGGTPTSLD